MSRYILLFWCIKQICFGASLTHTKQPTNFLSFFLSFLSSIHSRFWWVQSKVLNPLIQFHILLSFFSLPPIITSNKSTPYHHHPWYNHHHCHHYHRQGPRLTLKKSGGGTKYLKSGISTLTADISAKCHCFHKSGAFLELPMHEFSESVEKLKKNSLT